MRFNAQLNRVNATAVWTIDHDTYVIDFGQRIVCIARVASKVVVFDLGTALVTGNANRNTSFVIANDSATAAQVMMHRITRELCRNESSSLDSDRLVALSEDSDAQKFISTLVESLRAKQAV